MGNEPTAEVEVCGQHRYAVPRVINPDDEQDLQKRHDVTCMVSPPGHDGQHLGRVVHDDGSETVVRWGGPNRYDR